MALQERLVLTREEIRVIIFIVTATALGLTARHYRDTYSSTPDKEHLTTHAHRAPTPALSPNEARKHSRKKNQAARADNGATRER